MLRMVVIVLAVIAASAAVADSHEASALMQELESTLGRSISFLACGNAGKLESIGMDVDSCEAQVESLFRGCWYLLDSVEPEIPLEPTHFVSDGGENAELLRSTLTECLKASTLMFNEKGELRTSSPFGKQDSPKDED